MSPLRLPLRSGGIRFEDVWLDDRRRCTWALCAVSFELPADSVVAVVEPAGEGAAEGLLELVTGRRRAVRGRVLLDGAVRNLTIEATGAPGEQRLTVAGGVTIVVDPGPPSIASADRLLRFRAGVLQPDPAFAVAGSAGRAG